MSNVFSRDRARGCLLGQAIGDALGTTNEFRRLRADPFPRLNSGPQVEIMGGGPFGVALGQVTDDTQMAACIAASLSENKGLDVDDLARRYVAWSRVAFDIGNQTRSTLERVASGTSPRDSGYEVWAGASQPAGNGSLMRQSPFSVYFARDPMALRRSVLADGAITHADPRCQLACVGFAAALRIAIVDAEATPALLARAASEEIRAARSELDSRVEAALADSAVAALLEDLELATADDPELEGEVHLYRTQGFVRVAFRLAFWELHHADTFEQAVLDVANRGGDSDTNGAITGALLGALLGESKIPERWRLAVMNALEGESGPFATTYHPAELFRVIE
ncbi:MAG: ADP-ribosylglycohydrolase family protein [Deltaproteobacteria bacterium]|nr:ADP-ribosylglycohydrolase family protein [Deltaproteobacteria bacterium]